MAKKELDGIIASPGIRIGKCSIIGANSVVTGNVEPYSIYAGAPARKIRTLKTGKNFFIPPIILVIIISSILLVSLIKLKTK